MNLAGGWDIAQPITISFTQFQQMLTFCHIYFFLVFPSLLFAETFRNELHVPCPFTTLPPPPFLYITTMQFKKFNFDTILLSNMESIFKFYHLLNIIYLIAIFFFLIWGPIPCHILHLVVMSCQSPLIWNIQPL